MPDSIADPPYVGRFAPSPTGPLHFGSLVAAAGSYLHARAAGGRWLLRIEDVDTERNVPGAEGEILRALEAFGFEWDGPVLRQTDRHQAYVAALEALIRKGDVFGCACSRSEIGRAAAAAGFPRATDGGWVYPGTCRAGLDNGRHARAWRLRVPDATIGFDDLLQGRIEQHLAREVGDFVLKRADGPFAYQLAVVVDDAWQGVTHVVRGADLIDSTPRQIWLQRCLGVPTPAYLHLPVAVDAAGDKLSKQTHAPSIDAGNPAGQLIAALRFLGLDPPVLAVDELWRWAVAAFRHDLLPRAQRVQASSAGVGDQSSTRLRPPSLAR
jgi:glutamyl-Q tRNA(Asp) synthetase